MTIRPIVLVLALLASLAFAQAAAAQPITLHVTSARTVTNQPDPVELTGTISLAPNNSGSGTPVTGTGTLFTSELHVGDLIKPYTAPGAVPRWLVVASISSDTSLRVTQPGAGGGRYNGPAVSGVKFAALPAQVTISKGDPVTTFKYLVNQEDTDNNTQPASACQPSGPNDTLSSCLWTSIRHLSGSTNAAPGPYNPTTGFQGLVPDSSPVVTSGDQADFANGGTINLPAGQVHDQLRGRRPQDRRRALHDGQQRDDEGRQRPGPAVQPPARDAPRPGLQRQRVDERPVGRGRRDLRPAAQPRRPHARLHRAPRRHHGRGHDRLVRQSAVHDVSPHHGSRPHRL